MARAKADAREQPVGVVRECVKRAAHRGLGAVRADGAVSAASAGGLERSRAVVEHDAHEHEKGAEAAESRHVVAEHEHTEPYHECALHRIREAAHAEKEQMLTIHLTWHGRKSIRFRVEWFALSRNMIVLVYDYITCTSNLQENGMNL